MSRYVTGYDEPSIVITYDLGYSLGFTEFVGKTQVDRSILLDKIVLEYAIE